MEGYTKEEENHLLNGILYEIYFDSYGQFRSRVKNNFFEEVMALRSDPLFIKSFAFIRNALSPHEDVLYWIPDTTDEIIDVDIRATAEKITRRFGPEETYEFISKINVNGKDIKDEIGDRYGIVGKDGDVLQRVIANFLSAPIKLIQINSNLTLRRIAFTDKVLKSAEY